jgi:hypothetical protein
MDRWQYGDCTHHFILDYREYIKSCHTYQTSVTLSRFLILVFRLFHCKYFLKVFTSNFKYKFLVINHIICDKVHNSSTTIIRITSLELRIFIKSVFLITHISRIISSLIFEFFLFIFLTFLFFHGFTSNSK